jgi:hypothetical protein
VVTYSDVRSTALNCDGRVRCRAAEAAAIAGLDGTVGGERRLTDGSGSGRPHHNIDVINHKERRLQNQPSVRS